MALVRTLRVIVTLALLAVLPHPAGAEPLSRAEAVARALAANPEVLRSQEGLAILRGKGREALADALPELTVYGTGTRFRDPSLLNSPSFDEFPPEFREALNPVAANLFEGTAALKQTLWSFKLGRAIKAARLAVRFGHEDIHRVRQQIALDTVRAYNDYLLARERVVVTQKSVRLRESHLEMARNRRAAGVATELDVLRSQVDLENQKAQLERYRGEQDWAQGALNAAMVRPIETPIEPTDALTAEPLPVSVEEVTRAALETRPELKAAALNEKIRTELIGVARAESRPRLDFNGSYGYSVRQPGNFLEGDFAKWNAGITLTIPVFDGWRTAGKVAQARGERNQATQDRLALENRVRLEARQSLDRLVSAGRVLDASELNVTQATRALQMTQANYQHGAATTLDVLDAQAALTLAESLRLQSLYDHANARATLRFAMGQEPLDAAAPPLSSPAPPGAAATE
jgi:outer membrane protein TolC